MKRLIILPPSFDLGIHDSTSSWCSFLKSISVLYFLRYILVPIFPFPLIFIQCFSFSEKNSYFLTQSTFLGGGDFINSYSSNSLLNMSKQKTINEVSPVNLKTIYVLPNQSAQFNVSKTELIINLPKIP